MRSASAAAKTAMIMLTAVLATGLAGCSSSGSSKPATTASTSSPSTPASSSPASTSTAGSSTTAGGTGTAPATSTTITIKNFAFSPAQLSVHPGQKVTVVNSDSVAHTVTANPSGPFDTGTIQAGGTAEFTAPATAGTYNYICTIHTFMHGTLTVS